MQTEIPLYRIKHRGGGGHHSSSRLAPRAEEGGRRLVAQACELHSPGCLTPSERVSELLNETSQRNIRGISGYHPSPLTLLLPFTLRRLLPSSYPRCILSPLIHCFLRHDLSALCPPPLWFIPWRWLFLGPNRGYPRSFRIPSSVLRLLVFSPARF